MGLLGKLPNTIEIRAWNILKSEGISTLDQLCALSRRELLRVPNCGRKTVDAIEDALFAIGRELRSSIRVKPVAVVELAACFGYDPYPPA